MRFYILLTLIPAAAFAAASLLAAVAAAIAWRRVRGRICAKAASSRARTMGVLRLAPVATGALVAVILTAAFIRFEPRNTTETPGMLLTLGAAFALTLTLGACTRIGRAIRAGVRCARLLRDAGEQLVHEDGTALWVLDTQYPVAAVTGVFRAKVLLSTRVIRECTAGELDAIVSHERAHVWRRDNLVRAAMRYLPDPLTFFAAGREMEAVWSTAAEEAADDVAAGDADESRAILASALVRVAKMANGPAPDWMPGLAFHAGTNLETRVRRLLEGCSRGHRFKARNAATLTAVFACSALALTEPVARALHAWMEIAVQLTP